MTIVLVKKALLPTKMGFNDNRVCQKISFNDIVVKLCYQQKSVLM